MGLYVTDEKRQEKEGSNCIICMLRIQQNRSNVKTIEVLFDISHVEVYEVEQSHD